MREQLSHAVVALLIADMRGDGTPQARALYSEMHALQRAPLQRALLHRNTQLPHCLQVTRMAIVPLVCATVKRQRAHKSLPI